MTNDQNGGEPTDPPGVIALSPVIFVTALVVGFAVEWLSPSMVIASGSRIAPGIVVPIGGIVMIALGILQHRRSGNVPDPRHPDVTVMTSGIYRRTRNPIYIGYILVLAGIGLAANSLWVLVTVIPAYFVVRWGVIAREEAYLEAKFSQTYLDYKNLVRRWIQLTSCAICTVFCVVVQIHADFVRDLH